MYLQAFLPAARPVRLALGALAAYSIFQAGKCVGELLYYLQA
ncbi:MULTISPECIES: hypothetical protein [Hymenobacter]|nr:MULTISPECIES: hypothetical protein [Hymenobacter]